MKRPDILLLPGMLLAASAAQAQIAATPQIHVASPPPLPQIHIVAPPPPPLLKLQPGPPRIIQLPNGKSVSIPTLAPSQPPPATPVATPPAKPPPAKPLMAGVDWPMPAALTNFDRGNGRICAAMKPGTTTDKSNAAITPDLACACGQEYLAAVGNDAVAIRTRAQSLIGKSNSTVGPDIVTYTPGAATGSAFTINPKMFYSAQIAGQDFAGAQTLAAYSQGRAAAACTAWSQDRQKLPSLLASRKKVLDQIAQLQASMDKLRTAYMDSVAGVPSTPQGIATRAAASKKLYDATTPLQRQQNGLKNNSLPPLEKQLAQYPQDAVQAKAETYRGVQAALTTLWQLYRTETSREVGQVYAEQELSEDTFTSGIFKEMGSLGQKWAPIWKKESQEQEAQYKTAHNQPQSAMDYLGQTYHQAFWLPNQSHAAPPDFVLTEDDSGYLNDQVALCRREGPIFAQDADTHIREMPPIMDRMRTAWQSLKQDLPLWDAFSGRDAWPAAGSRDVSFGATEHQLFDNDVSQYQYSITVTPRNYADGPSMPAYGGVPFAVPPASIDPTPAGFWSAHRDCTQWYGAIADGSIAHGGAIWNPDRYATRGNPASLHKDWVAFVPGKDIWVENSAHIALTEFMVVFSPLTQQAELLASYFSGADTSEQP